MNDDTRTIQDILAPRSSFAQLTTPEVKDSVEAPVEEYAAFAHGRVGRRTQMMIVFRKCSGHVEVHAYSRLSRIRSENPDEQFTLSFGDSEVVIEGRHLATLFHYVCHHRAAEIVEADRTVVMAAGGECVVSAIRCGELSS